MPPDQVGVPSDRRWADPREHPDPPLGVSPRPPAPTVREILDLIRLCRQGHVYEVEAWIQDGKPLQALDYRTNGSHYAETPLCIAIETRQHDLARLLLANGYQQEEDGLETPLERALQKRAWDFVDLLLAWGADAKKVSPESVLDSYDSTLFERFWNYGLDYAARHDLADYLVSHTRNTPAFGWARKRKDEPRIARELAMALSEAISEDKERAVSLALWAGADPHLKVPSLKCPQPEEQHEDEDEFVSAIERAVSDGKGKYLAKLGPDPARDNFEAIWATVSDPTAVDVLAGISPPASWTPMIRRNAYWLTLDWGDRRAHRDAIERASTKYHAQLSGLDVSSCSDLRRNILKAKDRDDVRWLLTWLARPGNCDPATLAELTRTSAVRTKLVEFGLVRAKPPARQTRARKPRRRRALKRSPKSRGQT